MNTILRRRRNSRRLALALGLLAFPALSGCSGLPNIDEALANARAAAETSKIYAADGTLLKVLHAEENRENVPLTDVPMHVRNAVLAIEDARFYEHSGIDARAIARAFFVNRSKGRVVEGGSTITQQYVKNVLVGSERTMKRKIQEASLAYQLEQRYSKDKILELYLNTVYFGEGAYGIEAAALTYFGLHAKQLDLEQGALLAGLIRSPVRYDPYVNLKDGVARRNVVLDRMLDEHYLTQTQFAQSIKKPVKLFRRVKEQRFPAPYFVQLVEDLIQKDERFAQALGRTQAERVNALFKGGLRIHTTLDLRLQKAAETASRNTLPYKRDPYNAFVGMDPNNGHILSMVGGRDYFDAKDPVAKFNLAASRPGRQPGSTFKTFTLVAALEKGISLNKMYRGGSRITLTLPDGQVWRVPNYEGISFGGSLSVREATVKSVNVVYAQMIKEIGVKPVIDAAKRMGVTANLRPFYSITLGTETASPLDMASAYGTIANGGYYVQPTPISKITDARGKVLWEPSKDRKRVLDPAIVALATDALSDVVKRGTGRRQQLGRPAAGKTGTSDEYHDAWFVGFTPQYVAASWLGFPQSENIAMRPPRTRITVFGGSWPGSIWRQWMMEAHKGLPIAEFPYDPDNVVRLRIDTRRGCVAPTYPLSEVVVDKYFMRESAPTTACTGGPPIVTGSAPNVVGRLQAVAVELMQAAGFDVTIRKVYCPAYPTGYVCRQSPAPGKTGSTSSATIEVSDDSAVASVPMVLGETLDRARERLESAGFTVAVEYVPNSSGYTGCRETKETRAGVVWLQTPCAGATAGLGSVVRIFVNP